MLIYTAQQESAWPCTVTGSRWWSGDHRCNQCQVVEISNSSDKRFPETEQHTRITLMLFLISSTLLVVSWWVLAELLKTHTEIKTDTQVLPTERLLPSKFPLSPVLRSSRCSCIVLRGHDESALHGSPLYTSNEHLLMESVAAEEQFLTCSLLSSPLPSC